MRVWVVLRRDPSGRRFLAACPALPGCVAEGRTRDEAVRRVRRAIVTARSFARTGTAAKAGTDQILALDV